MSSSRLGVVRAVLVTILVQPTINAASLAWNEERAAPGVRGQQILHDLGEHLAVALAFVGLVTLWRRCGPRRSWHGWLASTVGLVVLAIPTIGEDAAGFVARFESDAIAGMLRWVVIGGVAVAVVAAALLGRHLGRRGLAGVATVVGVAVLVGNHTILRNGYPAAHLFLALAGVALAASALALLPLPGWWPRRAAGPAWIIAAGLAGFALISPPSNTVQLELLKVEGSVVAPYLTRLRSIRAADGVADVLPSWEPWFVRRDAAAAVPPTRPVLRRDDLVVVLVTIDSWRADLPLDATHDTRLPNLARLRDQSVYFTAARAPGSQTVYSLAELFAGTYFSQQYWSALADQRDRWPDDDATPRFPELLAAAGIPTVTFASAKWLVNRNGVVRGFTEEEVVPPRPGCFYGTTDEQMPRLLARLDAVGDGPAFIYAHVLDAHFNLCPISVGPPRSFAAYLAALEPVDRQLGALRARLDRPDLADRAVLIVSSDHGEAFGEHGAHNHRHNLYEELLRVPLLIYGRPFAPRRIDVPVSLIDLGPTILDLFGQMTPGHNLGQSLVPLVRGGPAPTRPIAAEGQLKKAMLFPDGHKAIVDDRNSTIEVYDLAIDPLESNNLVDRDDSAASDRIDVLRQFFKVHQIRRPGYTIPYRP